MTDATTDIAPEAVASDTAADTDVAVEVEQVEEVEEVEAPAAPAAAAEKKSFPTVVKRDEEAGITHYAPKAHQELDPSTSFTG